MRQFLASFILLQLLPSNSTVSTSDSVSTAIIKVIENMFVGESENFDLIATQRSSLDLLKKVANSMKKPAKILCLEDSPKFVLIENSAVFFFADLKVYKDNYKAILVNDFPREFRFLVYINSFNFLIPKKPLEPTQTFFHTNFLLNIDDTPCIDLITFTTFQKPKCRVVNPQHINRYWKGMRTWEKEEFSIRKFKNFDGCQLFLLNEIPGRILMIKVDEIVQKKLNYVIASLRRNNRTMADYILKDRLLRDSNDKLKILNKAVSLYTPTHHYTFIDRLFVVSRFEPLSNFKKTLLPFDDDVWFWLIGSLVLGVLVIFVVSFTKPTIRKFVFGSRVQAPLLNLV
jgi:hypothetical protein